MANKPVLGEVHDVLRILPFEQLKMFAATRLNEVQWDMWNRFVYDQKLMKMDQMYRLKRPKTADEMLRNTIDHEYYSARISGLVMLLQLMENASDELERRAKKER